MINNFKKIMVCLDGSKHSEKALNQAIMIAKKFDSKITLIHVVEPSTVLGTIQSQVEPFWGSISGSILQNSLDKEQKEGNKILTKNSSILEKEGISFDTKLLLGNPSEEILNFSKKQKVGVIVVGNLGKGILTRSLLGSVSTSISQKANCIVIIVR